MQQTETAWRGRTSTLKAPNDVPVVEMSREALLEEINQLTIALVRRDLIGQAKGIVRLLFGCDEQAAFTALARMSQDCNRKLYGVAAMLVERAASGEPLPRQFVVSLNKSLTRTSSRDLRSGSI